MLPMLQQLVAANTPVRKAVDEVPMADSAIRHKERGTKFCSYHKVHEPIDMFPKRIQNGKSYYESYCREGRNKMQSKGRVLTSACPLIHADVLKKLKTCERRRKLILAGKTEETAQRLAWKLEDAEAMFPVLPTEFTRDTAAFVWCMGTKLAAARYIKIYLTAGKITELPRASHKSPQIYRKKEL